MDKSIIQFPCFFPIKIIGKNSKGFEIEVTEIILSHFSGDPVPQISCKHSSESNYMSITATIYVHSQQALDSLYQELSKHPEMKMVL